MRGTLAAAVELGGVYRRVFFPRRDVLEFLCVLDVVAGAKFSAESQFPSYVLPCFMGCDNEKVKREIASILPVSK